MKLSRETIEDIENFVARSETSLSPYAIEKDFFVFQAIDAVSALNAETESEFRLVFCGGTCLEKAYGILGRMSEDIDFKVVPTDDCEGLSKSSLRRKLGDFAEMVSDQLSTLDFEPERKSRDENRYSVFRIPYQSGFARPGTFRQELLLELNFTSLTRPESIQKAGYLFDKLTTGEYSSPVHLPCVSIEEAFVEKLVSFPRRLAMDLARNSGTLSDRWDETLVRHLYDISRIRTFSEGSINDRSVLGDIFLQVIKKDSSEFASQHPEFLANFKGEISLAMEAAKRLPAIREQYDDFVSNMVFAQDGEIPTFDQAISNFSREIDALLSDEVLEPALFEEDDDAHSSFEP